MNKKEKKQKQTNEKRNQWNQHYLPTSLLLFSLSTGVSTFALVTPLSWLAIRLNIYEIVFIFFLWFWLIKSFKKKNNINVRPYKKKIGKYKIKKNYCFFFGSDTHLVAGIGGARRRPVTLSLKPGTAGAGRMGRFSEFWDPLRENSFLRWEIVNTFFFLHFTAQNL